MNIKTSITLSILLILSLFLFGCSEHGDFSKQQICKAGIATIKGKSPTIVSVDKIGQEEEFEVFHLSYKRPDDGNKWHYRCKIDKKRVVWAQGQDGRWRDQAQDPTIYFAVSGDEVNILEKFPDGSSSKDVTFNISHLGG